MHSFTPKMTTLHRSDAELLKEILANIHHPEALDGHPWAYSLFVEDLLGRHDHLRRAGRGRQLVAALGELFADTRPSTPPRRGKRLDTQWGEFGLLAALYFAPLQFGTPVPGSLRDAWGRIDPSILLYVDGHKPGEDSLDAEQLRQMYGLVSPEPEVAPISTLSDWHRKGIEKLAESVRAREKYLVSQALQAPSAAETSRLRRALPWKVVFLAVLLLLLVVLAWAGLKARRVYGIATDLRDDLYRLRDTGPSAPTVKGLLAAGPQLAKTRQDFDLFYNEVRPFLWLGPGLRSVPVYGGDLEASADLLALGDSLLASSEAAYAALQPALLALDNDASPDPFELVALLDAAGPQLEQSRHSLDRALELRASLDAGPLSPVLRPLLEENLDPLLPLLDDGLSLATSLPGLLGASSAGPKTYLLLVQNEDELRATGGFITAVGTLMMQNGSAISVSFVDSGSLDNWSLPYPEAPWQLQRYMNSPVLILRDANWSPDFPSSALTAETLYAYSNSHSVDGVIAFDQHMLLKLLEALGPVQVDGQPAPVDAGNVIAFMRASKKPPADQALPADWSNKAFMNQLASAMLVRLFETRDIDWTKMGAAVFQGLNGHHLLLQLDDPSVQRLVARHGWDGAVRYDGGDFLMVVDSNVGFNKTNAVVLSSLAYEVDLSDPAKPTGALTVTHRNNASADVPCIQWGGERLPDQQEYPVDACYWDYMRVYLPAGAELLQATPQNVPDDWMIFRRGVHGPVDVLEGELDGLQGLGMLTVVPGGESRTAHFRYRLPATALAAGESGMSYHLKIQKQPGTGAVPLTLRVHLPEGAALTSALPGVVISGGELYLETDLSTDLILELSFVLE